MLVFDLYHHMSICRNLRRILFLFFIQLCIADVEIQNHDRTMHVTPLITQNDPCVVCECVFWLLQSYC